MKKYPLIFVILAAFLFDLPLACSQGEIISEEESIVDISPAELQILLEELMQAKKERLTFLAVNQPSSTNNNATVQDALEAQNLRQQMDKMQKTLNGIHQKINQSPSATTENELDRQDLDFVKKQLLGEMQSLKAAFYALTLKTTPPSPPSSSNATDNSNEHLIIFATQMMQLRSTLDSLFFKMNGLVEKEEFGQLRQQLDGLEKKFQQPIYTNPAIDESLTKQWEKQFNELRALIAQTNQTPTTVIPVTTTDTEYELLKAMISTRTQDKVYFPNNSFQLIEANQSVIQELAALVKEHERLDILVIGYADEKGNTFYNQELSQNRAETIKKFLMQQGIHPNRIFTQSHGVDYTAENKAAARRVDLVMLIKR